MTDLLAIPGWIFAILFAGLWARSVGRLRYAEARLDSLEAVLDVPHPVIRPRSDWGDASDG